MVSVRCGSINRNILECKYFQDKSALLFFQVLIETYWNVNDYKQPVRRKENNVLIETYWNVNGIKEIGKTVHLKY